MSAILPPNVLRCMDAKERKAMGKAGELPEEIQARVDEKSHRELQNDLVALLSLRGVTPLAAPGVGKSKMKLGWPDLTFAYRGVPCVWEIKVGRDTLRTEQIQLQAELQKPENGWRHAVIRSVQEAKMFLDAMDKCIPIGDICRATLFQSLAKTRWQRQFGRRRTFRICPTSTFSTTLRPSCQRPTPGWTRLSERWESASRALARALSRLS